MLLLCCVHARFKLNLTLVTELNVDVVDNVTELLTHLYTFPFYEPDFVDLNIQYNPFYFRENAFKRPLIPELRPLFYPNVRIFNFVGIRYASIEYNFLKSFV